MAIKYRQNNMLYKIWIIENVKTSKKKFLDYFSKNSHVLYHHLKTALLTDHSKLESFNNL